MSTIHNLSNTEAVDKLKSLVSDIKVCLFGTLLNSNQGSTARPMFAIKVCDQGNIWFFSDKNSDKNREIEIENQVQLFFSHPSKNLYLVVNGTAEIIFDTSKIEELWTPEAKIWYKDGKDDPNISIIKVKPSSAYYWDTDGNQMINFFKMVASVATGINLVTSSQGTLKP